MDPPASKAGARLWDALQARYGADIAECQATLAVYRDSPVGIGEHPQHLEEMDKLLERMAAAVDKLSAMRRCDGR